MIVGERRQQIRLRRIERALKVSLAKILIRQRTNTVYFNRSRTCHALAKWIRHEQIADAAFCDDRAIGRKENVVSCAIVPPVADDYHDFVSGGLRGWVRSVGSQHDDSSRRRDPDLAPEHDLSRIPPSRHHQ